MTGRNKPMLQNKLAVDTCAFAEMVNYSNTYRSGGYDALSKLIITNSIKLTYLKSSVISMFNKNFIEQNEELYSLAKNGSNSASNYALSMLLEKYKEYSRDLIIRYVNTSKRINNLINHLKNESLTSAQKTDIDLKIKMYQSRLLDMQGDYTKICQFDKSLDNTRQNYNSTLTAVTAGEMFQDCINGKVELVILPTTHDEILNHTDLPEKSKSLQFSGLETSTLLRYCTIYSTKSTYVINEINKISRALRTSYGPNDYPMNDERNLTGEPADPNSIAEAIVFGVNFATLNVKHYIRAMELKGYNDEIRQHIIKVCNKYYPDTDCALPYSFGEYAQGLIKNDPVPVKGFKVIQSSVYQNYVTRTNEVVNKNYK